MKIIVGLLISSLGWSQQINGVLSAATHHSAASFTGVGDIASGAIAYWGLRAYSAAKRGTKVANLCDASDVHCADALSDSTTGALVVPSSNPNCTVSNTCTVKILYDQIGTGCSGNCDLSQSTIADRPTLTINCSGFTSQPCMTFASTQAGLNGPTFITSPIAQPITFSAVMKRTSNFTTRMDTLGDGHITMGWESTTNTAFILGGTPFGDATASNSTWHALQGLFSGASSNLTVDGSSNSITTGTTGLSGVFCMGNCFAGTDGTIAEFAPWGSDKSANFAALNSNQHTFWGF